MSGVSLSDAPLLLPRGDLSLDPKLTILASLASQRAPEILSLPPRS